MQLLPLILGNGQMLPSLHKTSECYFQPKGEHIIADMPSIWHTPFLQYSYIYNGTVMPAKERIVPTGVTTQKVLWCYFYHFKPELINGGTNNLFLTLDGTLLSTNAIKLILQRWVKKAAHALNTSHKKLLSIHKVDDFPPGDIARETYEEAWEALSFNELDGTLTL